MDYAGHVVAPKEIPNDASEFIYATFTKEELTKWRSKIPVFNDADNFTVDL
jgi:predicted amidohydrolase